MEGEASRISAWMDRNCCTVLLDHCKQIARGEISIGNKPQKRAHPFHMPAMDTGALKARIEEIMSNVARMAYEIAATEGWLIVYYRVNDFPGSVTRAKEFVALVQR